MPEPKQSSAAAAPADATNETLADIIAQMRRWNKEGATLVNTGYIADRIEAAAERERDEDRQLAAIAESDEAFARCARCDRPERATGNAAAMREALEEQSRYWWSHVRNYSENEMLKRTDAALAAPARNCDRFKTEDDAYSAFNAANPNSGADTAERIYEYCRWLFATAKGGAKCVNGLRGEPDCRGCHEHCEDVRKRNCFYWNPDIEGGVCALDGKPSCRISCDNFHIPEKVSPPPAEGGAK